MTTEVRIRRKVIDSEPLGSDLGGQKHWLTLECGHSFSWGHHNAFSPPKTTRCPKCERAGDGNSPKDEGRGQ